MKRRGRNKMLTLKSLLLVISEFFKALGKSHTYSIRRNGYVMFGILWGIPVPIVTVSIGLYLSGMEYNIQNMIGEISRNPMHIFFLLHPVIFGVVFGAMGTVRDEKEKQKLEFKENLITKNAELAFANKKLKQLDEMKDNFLSMISHELKTPLTVVQGYVTFVKKGKAGPVTEKQEEVLGIAEEQTHHLDHLIGDLVELSRIESGEFSIEQEPVDIVSVARKAVSSLKQSFDDNEVDLEDKLSDKPFFVIADPERMMQVFMNLLGNAKKFTPPGGKVTVESKVKGDIIEISVSDTGIGIPGDKVNKVFDRFYQVDSTGKRKYGGCGLGLAITKSILKMHDESVIKVESEPGKGSRFFFEMTKCENNNGDKKGEEL